MCLGVCVGFMRSVKAVHNNYDTLVSDSQGHNDTDSDIISTTTKQCV